MLRMELKIGEKHRGKSEKTLLGGEESSVRTAEGKLGGLVSSMSELNLRPLGTGALS